MIVLLGSPGTAKDTGLIFVSNEKSNNITVLAPMPGSRADLWRMAFASGPKIELSVYYNETRTHLGLEDAPLPRPAQRAGTIVSVPILSALHHRYARTRFSGNIPLLRSDTIVGRHSQSAHGSNSSSIALLRIRNDPWVLC